MPDTATPQPGCDPDTPAFEAARLLTEVGFLSMRRVRATLRGREHRDLSMPQFRLLVWLRHRPGASLSEVAKHVGLTPPAASRLVEGLVTRHLVTREPAAADRRRLALTVTPAGLATVLAADDAILGQLAEFLAALPEADLNAALRSLRLLRDTFAAGWDPTEDLGEGPPPPPGYGRRPALPSA